jgi:protocatechuate 3,4-dioxygenase beta subunit
MAAGRTPRGYSRRTLLGLFGLLSSVGAMRLPIRPLPVACPVPDGPRLFQARAARIDQPAARDPQLDRSNLIHDPTDGTAQPGVLLRLRFTVYDGRPGVEPCTPLTGARVDLWGVNYRGFYSDVNDPALNTLGKKFLRGYQFTDAAGLSVFETLYPGWYYSRAVHLHFRIEAAPEAGQAANAYSGQVFFDDALSDRVYQLAPYNRRGPRHTRNSMDALYRQAQADAEAGKNGALVLDVAPILATPPAPAESGGVGYTAAFAVVLAPPSDEPHR